MKLIQEYTIKIIIQIFAFTIAMEIVIMIILLNRSGTIFLNTYNQTIARSELKSIDITKKLETYITNLLTRFSTDLKLIGKHALLFNKFKNSQTSTILINTEKNKEIIYAKFEELINNKIINKTFNEFNQRFDFSYFYEEEFKNIQKNQILNSLFSDSHSELNIISYYSISNDEVSQNLAIKYLISILKTIYIRRYISKRANFDYVHFLILNKEELYIYPPDSYNNTFLYNFQTVYSPPLSNCMYNSSNISQKFPLCIYDFLNNKIKSKDDNYITLIFESIFYEYIFAAMCLKIKISQNDAFICLESDLTKFLNTFNFKNPENLDFGVLYLLNGSLVPLSYGRKSVYKDIKDVFNDTVTRKYIINEQSFPIYYFFHFLYYNLTKVAKEHPELNVNFTEIEEEYNILHNKIMSEIEEYNKTREADKISFTFSKTICRKAFINNYYECTKDDFEMIIIPLLLIVNKVNKEYLETQDEVETDLNIFIFSILSTNPSSNREKIFTILNIKLVRTIVLFFFITTIIISFFLLLINIISEYFLNTTNQIINELKTSNINFNSQKCYVLNEDKISSYNKEMSELKSLYTLMIDALIIKQAFEKENYLEKNNLDFYNLVQNIERKNVKEICNAFLGFYHFKHDSFSLAENEFRSTLLFIKDNENRIITGKNKEYEEKIKDEIKRSCTVSYINEYSKFEGVDEILFTIINLKIFKQRFSYLYGLTKFKLGSEINTNNLSPGTNKNKIQKEKDKKKTYFKEAIKYFTKCKNINSLLGINQIKIIYSLIMISKCHIQLNDYKYAITNINEALSLFFEFSKSFKEYHYKNYNPKVMLFIENNIFQYILYTIDRICYTFNKPFASNWIGLKIFETSPFIISNVHYYTAIFLQNYLEGKIKWNKSDIIRNNILSKDYDKVKKFISKIIPRMNIKNINNKKRKLINDSYITDTASYSTSIKNKTESKTDKSLFSSTYKREMATGKISASIYTKNKNLNKIITLCLSEKVLKNVNGLELKDVIIKYFQKYFIMNENDKFSFIQFANNGKKTVHFKMEQLDYFILKIQKTKNTFELTESFETNSNLPFMELFNILESIIKNYPSQDDCITDNIIIMLINSDDIRFRSIPECLKIVEELNKKNATVYLLSYDDGIKKEKINNIHSFLNGLFEGHFFQIKSYQQLKQIFINISTIKYQSNFFGYDYESLDYLL